jgi:hypothetical protein
MLSAPRDGPVTVAEVSGGETGGAIAKYPPLGW